MVRLRFWLAVAVVAVAALPGFCKGGISSATAVARAAAYLGVDPAKAKVSVRKTVVEGDNTAFVSTLINGRRAYQVTFKGIELRVGQGDGDQVLPNITELTALIEADSGVLLKAWSPQMFQAPTLSTWTSEQTTKRLGSLEKWSGFPSGPPAASLLEVMRHLYFDTPVEQINVVYVLASDPAISLVTHSSDPCATWMITVRTRQKPSEPENIRPETTTPFPVYGGRHAVDGRTGNWRFSTTRYSSP